MDNSPNCLPIVSPFICSPKCSYFIVLMGQRMPNNTISASKLFKFHRFCPTFRPMHKEHRWQHLRLPHTDEQAADCHPDGRLNSIIRTFRQNNMRLMQKIEECDRMRQIERTLNQKKLSERHLLEPFDPLPTPHEAIAKRPLSQFKTERLMERAPRHKSRKENVAFEPAKRNGGPKA
jgi:hypothetical protein